jgi:putative intracellular protease/amidase
MRDTIYFLVFDGFADWGAALALCEIRRPGEWQVATVGFSLAPVQSMGGLTILPELTLAQMDTYRAALLLLPGGYVWESDASEPAVGAIARMHAAGVPVAAICSATLGLARAGLLDQRRHTSSFPGYLDTCVSGYRGADYYDADVLAVSDGDVITAHGLGSVEFAHEIIQLLNLYGATEREHWYRLFKYAIHPPLFEGKSAKAA